MLAGKPFKKFIFNLILFSTLVRCVIAFYIGLGNDEVYYFTYATQPDWNHFDHPPLVGILIRIFTFNLHWNNASSMRLPAILAAGINTWLIAECGRLIKSERTGMIAAILYNTSIYTSIIAGLFILPDSPQLVFWLAAICCMLKIISLRDNQSPGRLLLLAGFWIGLAMLCKVHALFLWVGFGGYILFNDRKILVNPNLYLGLLVSIIMISPIVFWNMQNHFITWQFHGERVGITDSGVNFKAFFTTLAGQILYNNPVHIFLYVIVLAGLLKSRGFLPAKSISLLLWCSLPLIFATTAASVFRPALPHWSGPGFIALMLLSAAYADDKIRLNRSRLYSALLYCSAGLTLIVIIVGTALIRFYPGTLGSKEDYKTGSGDVTLDMYGWEELLPAFEKTRNQDIEDGKMAANSPLLVHKWFPAGHLYFYVAFPLSLRVVGEGELNDLHKFVWLNQQNGNVAKATNAYFIAPSNYFSDPAMIYGDDFESVTLAAKIPQQRNGKTARYWYVYRLVGAKKMLGKQI